MNRLFMSIVAIAFASACRSGTDRNAAIGEQPARDERSATKPSPEAMEDARMRRIKTLRCGCSSGDWGDLALMATNRFDWGDDLAAKDRSGAETVQCTAITALGQYIPVSVLPENSKVAVRTFAAGFKRPAVLAALEDTLMGRAEVPSKCKDLDTSELFSLVPIHELRPVFAVRAPQLVKYLDADQALEIGARAARVESWAAELTPDGFARVLQVLQRDYVWNDGAPEPSKAERAEIEQHAVNMIAWLGRLIVGESAKQCGCLSKLRDAVETGKLGALVVARLDSPSPQVRAALLTILMDYPRPEALPRLADLQEHDRDPGVRLLAKSVREWADRGGRVKWHEGEAEDWSARHGAAERSQPEAKP